MKTEMVSCRTALHPDCQGQSAIRRAVGVRVIALDFATLLFHPAMLPAQLAPAVPAICLELGRNTFQNWSGLAAVSQGAATIGPSGEATFRYPDGLRGQYKHGFRVLNDSAAEW